MSLCLPVLGGQETEVTQASLNFSGALSLGATAEVRNQADDAHWKHRGLCRLLRALLIIPCLLCLSLNLQGPMCTGMCDKADTRLQILLAPPPRPTPTSISRHLGSWLCFQWFWTISSLAISQPYLGLQQMLTNWWGNDFGLLLNFAQDRYYTFKFKKWKQKSEENMGLFI